MRRFGAVWGAGAVFAGFIGLPGVLGGSQFAHWLEPVIAGHGESHASHALEWVLMAVSVTVAALGVFIAFLMYRRESLSPEAAKKQLLAEKQPSHEFATPEQIGDVAAFLCSDAAAQIRGIGLSVDGGWTAP